MGSFRTRKIRQKPPFRPFKGILKFLKGLGELFTGFNKRHVSYVMGAILVVVSASIVVKVTRGAVHAVQNFSPEEIVLAAGSDLKKDEYGYTNIVLLGDGGHVRDGADLIDTIMVASLDFEDGEASLMSIPRDYYVRSQKYGSSKVNEVYRNNKYEYGEVGAYDVYKEVVGEVANLDMHYYLRVDFNAFVEVVDSLGGIEVDVQNAIYDPYYPNETDNGYTVFQVDAGPQQMTGETALKFVRSRKTTSDFDRAARQQQVLVSIRDKALSSEVYASPKKIKAVYNSVSSNINTDLSIREMITLASFAKRFDRSKIVSKVMHDDPTADGGFLYTPERKYYNGQFVLVPYGNNLDWIHRYADLIFHRRNVLQNPVRIEVLNATKKPGIARELANFLDRFGLNVVNIDNLEDGTGERKHVERTFLRYNSWQVDTDGSVIAHHQDSLDALGLFVNGEPIPSDENAIDTGVDISVVIGEDYEFY